MRRLQQWPIPSYLETLAYRALRRVRRRPAFESCSSLNIFRLSFRSCFYITAVVFLVLILSSAFQKYDIHIIHINQYYCFCWFCCRWRIHLRRRRRCRYYGCLLLLLLLLLILSLNVITYPSVTTRFVILPSLIAVHLVIQLKERRPPLSIWSTFDLYVRNNFRLTEVNFKIFCWISSRWHPARTRPQPS